MWAAKTAECTARTRARTYTHPSHTHTHTHTHAHRVRESKREGQISHSDAPAVCARKTDFQRARTFSGDYPTMFNPPFRVFALTISPALLGHEMTIDAWVAAAVFMAALVQLSTVAMLLRQKKQLFCGTYPQIDLPHRPLRTSSPRVSATPSRAKSFGMAPAC
eukprot:COSAG02_NODE_2020_length_10087_cov_4.239688_2_plen_163_part_00